MNDDANTRKWRREMFDDKKLNIGVEPPLMRRLNSVLPWGSRGVVLTHTVEMLVSFLETYGPQAANIILDKQAQILIMPGGAQDGSSKHSAEHTEDE